MGRRAGSWDPPAWGGPWKGLLLAASVLGSCLQPAPAQTPVTIVLSPPSPEVGGGVSLAPQNPPQDFVLCYWYRSATTAVNNRILTYFPKPSQQNGSAHTGRETAGPGCVLHIAGLMLNYTGNYTVEIQTETSSGLGTVPLRVYEKLAKPMVMASKTQVPENGTLTLTCNTSPSADTVLWLQNGSYIAPNKQLGLSPDNRTLTVQNFTWGDAGTYQCEVRNPVSTERSEPSTVTLAYGPESARIDPPGPVNLTLGSRLTLTCVADSVPAPSYSWFLNGNKLPQIGSSLTFDLTTLNLGTYKCQADNPVTGLTANAEIEVLGEQPGTAPHARICLRHTEHRGLRCCLSSQRPGHSGSVLSPAGCLVCMGRALSLRAPTPWVSAVPAPWALPGSAASSGVFASVLDSPLELCSPGDAPVCLQSGSDTPCRLSLPAPILIPMLGALD